MMSVDKELLQTGAGSGRISVSTLYDVSHHSFEISRCNFGPEVIATTSVIPMWPEYTALHCISC